MGVRTAVGEVDADLAAFEHEFGIGNGVFEEFGEQQLGAVKSQLGTGSEIGARSGEEVVGEGDAVAMSYFVGLVLAVRCRRLPIARCWRCWASSQSRWFAAVVDGE